MNIDPSKCTFGMEEGKFLSYVATTEGRKADQEKVIVILRSTTPSGPGQIRNLSLQLTNISRFIPKLAELMLPIRNIRRSLDAVETSNQTSQSGDRWPYGRSAERFRNHRTTGDAVVVRDFYKKF
ncbi:hypothetical protein Tco_0211502 [Tanacetum coccineum]